MRYRPDTFVLEGGSIHVDGEGTVITTEMCLLSPRAAIPELSKEDIEGYLREYLGVEKVIWIKDGIDPDETNGHIDDVACFVAPRRGGLHLDRRRGQPVLRGRPRRLRHAVATPPTPRAAS